MRRAKAPAAASQPEAYNAAIVRMFCSVDNPVVISDIIAAVVHEQPIQIRLVPVDALPVIAILQTWITFADDVELLVARYEEALGYFKHLDLNLASIAIQRFREGKDCDISNEDPNKRVYAAWEAICAATAGVAAA